MSLARKAAPAFTVALLVAGTAWAQFSHPGARHPAMPNLLNPVVGSGAEYQMTSGQHQVNFTYAVVGKEQVAGDQGYWLEIRTESPESQGEMVMKQLVVPGADHPKIERMIVQPPGRPPMEMPSGMSARMNRSRSTSQSGSGLGEKVGNETITVPAGSFECDHYRKQENGKTIDYWISTKVSPYGLVKMTSADTTLVLQKTLTNETSHIKGEPQKMNFPSF